MREEIIDPHYWDELLPGIVDVESGHGSSFLDPIIIPTFGDKERVLGCIGDCSEFDGDIENANFKFCLLSEDTFSVCTHCGLHFFFVLLMNLLIYLDILFKVIKDMK